MEQSGPETSDAQHIFNKAVFDGVNEALLQLLLVEGAAPASGAQRRICRAQPGSERWKQAVREEVGRAVRTWSAPRLSDDVAALLQEDIPQVHLASSSNSTCLLLRYWAPGTSTSTKLPLAFEDETELPSYLKNEEPSKMWHVATHGHRV